MPDFKAQDQEWSSAMRAALAGDGEAYRRLLIELSPYLRNLCRKACARAGLAPSEAEDAVQETLLAIHLKRHTWDPAQGLTPWIADIHVFAIASTMSFGPSGSSINAMTTAVPRLVHGLTRGLFRADIERHWASFRAYDVPQAIVTRQRSVAAGPP